MSSLPKVLCAVAVAGLMFSSTEAEARFGKRSSSDDSKKEKKEKKQSKVHDASAVGSSRDEDEDPPAPPPQPRRSRVVFVDPQPEPPVRTYYVASAPVVETAPQSVAVAPSAEVQTTTTPEKLGSNVRFGVDGAAMGGGTAATLFLGIEGERLGMDLRGTALTLPTDDGTPGTDSIGVGNLHLTYALVARDNLRVRMEGGFSMAQAPDLTVVAPSFALSLEGCLTGSLDLELRAQATPYPYQQVDAQAALALRLKALVLRGGWRGLYLNDNGLVDDVEHEDAFGGPFLGLGLTF